VSGDANLDMYTAYLAARNDRDWPAIAGFVHSRVLVNGVERTRAQYVDDIRKANQRSGGGMAAFTMEPVVAVRDARRGEGRRP
jgi:predicted ester cyclase